MNTKLYDQTNSYKALDRDLAQAKQRVIIESPFLTTKRVMGLLPILRKLVKKHVQIVINTKPFNEHNEYLKNEAIRCIALLQENDVLVLNDSMKQIVSNRRYGVLDILIAHLLGS